MRELNTYDGAEVELRADEIVYADFTVTTCGFRHVVIMNEEDCYKDKQQRLLYRRHKRREKRNERDFYAN